MPGANTFDEIAKSHQLLKRFGGSYWIAGGWAVDVFLGRQTRFHEDIEVAISRDEQQLLWKLDGIERIDFIGTGIAKPWLGQRLDLPIHQLRCYFGTGEALEVLLSEFDQHSWLYRRDLEIKRSRDVLALHAGEHLPIEIVLLFKSKALREKDRLDFTNALGAMDGRQAAWLRRALLQTAPSHPWLKFL